jgi:hypothetical protein
MSIISVIQNILQPDYPVLKYEEVFETLPEAKEEN